MYFVLDFLSFFLVLEYVKRKIQFREKNMNKIIQIFTRSLCVLCLSVTSMMAWAQKDYAAAMVAEVSGLVENDEGNMVEPKAAFDASVDITTKGGGDIVARVTGVAACTEGLGLQITFDVTFDSSTLELSGLYTDIPNGDVLDKPIVFENVGGLNWRANIAGNAPAANGTRAYDLTIDVTLPKEAIFPGDEYPKNKSFSGSLDQTINVAIPLVIKELNYDETLNLAIKLSGAWSAKAVPTSDGSVQDITGMVNGSIAGSEPVTLSFDIPGAGKIDVPVDIQGSFGGSLFVSSKTQLKFAGAWAASSGEKGFGGDLEITLPINNLKNLKSIPFSFGGNFAVDPGVPNVDPILIPLNLAGEFPFSIDI
jgi:hypothetical protein